MKHPLKHMLWGYFISRGYGSLVPVEEMMNSENYASVLQDKNCAFRASVI